MKTNSKKTISGAAIRRIPMYLFYLKSLQIKGLKYITAPSIGNVLDVDPTQIRKDFAEISIKGKTKIGYEISTTIEKIEIFLGYHIHRQAFLVGAGNLGTALLNYADFHTEGIEIIKGFDLDLKKIETEIKGVVIFDIQDIQEHFTKTPVDIAIIATPHNNAQEVLDFMIEVGVKAFWNFSTMPLSAPSDIIIENTCIDSSLAMIKWKLQNKMPLIYKHRVL